jgi:hypothetical protein
MSLMVLETAELTSKVWCIRIQGELDSSNLEKLKAAFDFTPTLRGAYTFGIWHNDTDASAETYLRTAAGDPTFAGVAGFASGTFHWLQQHTAHSVTLTADKAARAAKPAMIVRRIV